jgi:hypothetical protein
MWVLFVNTKKDISLTKEGAERRESASDNAVPADGDTKKENASKEPLTAQKKTAGQSASGGEQGETRQPKR